MAASVHEIAAFLDELLDVASISDASRNGLQVESGASVDRIGLAVDAAGATIAAAIAAECQLLLVHHGLLWGAPQRLVGPFGSRVGACYRGGLSVYASHLPLDVHPTVGNNALLAGALGAEPTGGFGVVDGTAIGVVAVLPESTPLATVAGRLAAAGCDEQIMWAFGPDPVRTLAVMTGSGCSALDEAMASGADCFVSGEPKHSAYHEARDGGINCLFGGHYATETFGVRALGALLGERFDVDLHWIELPTGI